MAKACAVMCESGIPALVDHGEEGAQRAEIHVTLVHVLRLPLAERVDDLNRLTLLAVIDHVAKGDRLLAVAVHVREAFGVCLKLLKHGDGDLHAKT